MRHCETIPIGGQLAALGKQVLVITLSVWFVLFAPLFCQFHGLLMGLHTEPAQDETPFHHPMPEILCGEVALPIAVQPAPGTPLWNVHQTTPGTTLMASLYLMVLPVKQCFTPINPLNRLMALLFLPPIEPDLPIPKQPPRL